MNILFNFKFGLLKRLNRFLFIDLYKIFGIHFITILFLFIRNFQLTLYILNSLQISFETNHIICSFNGPDTPNYHIIVYVEEAKTI